MKTIYKIFFTVALSTTLFGCVDMDTCPEGDIVTEDQKKEVLDADPSKTTAGVNSVFSRYSMYCAYTSNHNDFGYPALMLTMDSNGFDMPASTAGYNWFGRSLNYADRDYEGYLSKFTWNTMYALINNSNKLLAALSDKMESTDPNVLYNLGQALAARASNYWVLAQLYQFNYVGHESAPCVPIITEENMLSVAVDGVPRSTVQEVYDLILKDITTAIDKLKLAKKAGLTPVDKRYIGVDVAYGIRARVNLTMQKWAAAAEDAQNALDNTNATPYTIEQVSVPTMYSSNDNSWMWGIIISENDRVVTSGIINFPSHMGSLNFGYAKFFQGRQVNKKLYKNIDADDVRKGWFLDENCQSQNIVNYDKMLGTGNAIQKYVKEFRPYTQVKFAPYKDEVGTSTNACDIPLMRVEEMYLIKAEALAMSGNLAEAKTTLINFLTTYRNPSYVCKASSAEDFQDEVYIQRRIEFYGEGMSWFDIMRLNKPVDRRGCGYLDPAVIFNIPAGSNILLWRIPDDEIQGNNQLTNEDNNPFEKRPDPVPDN